MQFVLPGQQLSFATVSRHFGDEFFINKAQLSTRFAYRLTLKDRAVPAIKYPSHDSEPEAFSETASHFCVLLAISASKNIFFYKTKDSLEI